MGSRHDAKTLAELPAAVSCARGRGAALRVGEEWVTFEALERLSTRVAAALARDGVGEGDRVALVARDSASSLAVLFGAAKVKAVCVPIDGRRAVEEIAFVLEDARPKLVFFDPELGLRLWETLRRNLDLWAVSLPDPAVRYDGFTRWCAGAPERPPARDYHPDDVVVQAYAGATGRPTGVPLANRSFWDGAAAGRASVCDRVEDMIFGAVLAPKLSA